MTHTREPMEEPMEDQWAADKADTLDIQRKLAAYRQGRKRKSNAGRPGAKTVAMNVDLTVDEGGYAVDEFYCGSTNKYDHSEQIRVKIPKHVNVMLRRAVEDPNLPAYRSASDFVRDAIVHRLYYLQHEYLKSPNPDYAEWVDMMTVQGRLAALRAERETNQEITESLIEDIAATFAANDRAGIEELAIIAADYLLTAPQPYRGRVYQELKRAFVRLDADLSVLATIKGDIEAKWGPDETTQ